MIVATGEHPRVGKRSGQTAGKSEAKDLIFGDAPPPGPLRGSRPPPQPAGSWHVDASTGPPASLMPSRVGPGRTRRPTDSEEDALRRFNEDAAQAFRDSRAARQQTKDAQGKVASPFACAEAEPGQAASRPESFGRRPSRERREGPQVDREMAELLSGIEQTAAELDHVSAADAYLEAQAVAERGRARARGHGIFGDAPAEEVTIRRDAAPASLQQGPFDAQAAAGYDEARLQRQQALAKSRGAAGGIFACDEPKRAPPPRGAGSNIISW